jgi:hypothetical protein
MYNSYILYMLKKILLLSCVFLVIMVPYANAFSVFGVDLKEVWDKITFWNNEESKKEVNSNNNLKKVNPELLNLGLYSYKKEDLKNTINSNDMAKDYINKFNYDCIYVLTDKGVSFSFIFNPDKGMVNDIKIGKHCEREIKIEDSLIKEFQKNGFDSSKIKTYLNQVDLPWSVYAKAGKIFLIG